jgi:hypothetical protein
MRYLLDELTVYEEGFGDILMGDRASKRHETFMGAQDLSASISRSDLLVFETKLLQQMREFMTIGTSPPNPSLGTSTTTSV